MIKKKTMNKKEILDKIKEIMVFDIAAESPYGKDAKDIKNLNELHNISVNYFGDGDDFNSFGHIDFSNDSGIYLAHGNIKFKNIEKFKSDIFDFLCKPHAHNPNLVSRFILEFNNDFVEFDEVTWDGQKGIDKFKEANPDKELKYLILKKIAEEREVDGITHRYYYHSPCDKDFTINELKKIIDKECENNADDVFYKTLILVTQHFMFDAFDKEGVSFIDGGANGSISFDIKTDEVYLSNTQMSFAVDENGDIDWSEEEEDDWDPIKL